MSLKYIFVLGGVTSSLGKGILSASVGKVLQANGYKVTMQKFDPYINVDPGTLNPYEHGECFVTEDGAEADLDLGHYERFLNINTSKHSNVTTGRIYQNVIQKERKGEYLGKTVQVIPHITNEIKQYIRRPEHKDVDIVITEVGGTVGDIESLPFIEAIRQFKLDVPSEDCLVMMLTLIPYLKAAGELKTKPTQNSVKILREAGIQADILVCRVDDKNSLDNDLRKKIALFCNLHPEDVFESYNAKTIYDVPDNVITEKLDKMILAKLRLPGKRLNIQKWRSFLDKLSSPQHTVRICLVGKYVELQDAYKSINEAFTHAGAHQRIQVEICNVHSEDITQASVGEKLKAADGILIAPGFGERGIEGKLIAIHYARTQRIPLFGICLGMQLACVEFARNVLGLSDANSTEMNPATSAPVIYLMEEQKHVKTKGATMRLGAYDCVLQKNTRVYDIYKKRVISERHRHRFEFNMNYLEAFQQHGFLATGINEQLGVVEIMELSSHPFFLGVQFHPEFKSTPENPHPLFIAFLNAALEQKNNTQK